MADEAELIRTRLPPFRHPVEHIDILAPVVGVDARVGGIRFLRFADAVNFTAAAVHIMVRFGAAEVVYGILRYPAGHRIIKPLQIFGLAFELLLRRLLRGDIRIAYIGRLAAVRLRNGDARMIYPPVIPRIFIPQPEGALHTERTAV